MLPCDCYNFYLHHRVRPSIRMISLRWSFISQHVASPFVQRCLSILRCFIFYRIECCTSWLTIVSHRLDCTSNAHKVKEIPRANLKRLALRCRGTHAIRFRLHGRGLRLARGRMPRMSINNQNNAISILLTSLFLFARLTIKHPLLSILLLFLRSVPCPGIRVHSSWIGRQATNAICILCGPVHSSALLSLLDNETVPLHTLRVVASSSSSSFDLCSRSQWVTNVRPTIPHCHHGRMVALWLLRSRVVIDRFIFPWHAITVIR